jgi:hypothetical protein
MTPALSKALAPRAYLRNGSLVRLAFGVTGLVAPARLCRACAVPAAHLNEDAEYLMRLFAARELLLAAHSLRVLARRDEDVLGALDVAAAVGALDVGILIAERRRRRAFTGPAAIGVAFALSDAGGFTLVRTLAQRARVQGGPQTNPEES